MQIKLTLERLLLTHITVEIDTGPLLHWNELTLKRKRNSIYNVLHQCNGCS